jgi:hypothetical protein
VRIIASWTRRTKAVHAIQGIPQMEGTGGCCGAAEILSPRDKLDFTGRTSLKESQLTAAISKAGVGAVALHVKVTRNSIRGSN